MAGRGGTAWSWVWRWAPLLLWILVIGVFSTDDFSSEETGSVLLPWLEWLFPWISDAGLDALHIALRKAGHVTEFGVLALLWYRALAWRRSGWRGWAAAVAALLALGIAAVDEWGQGFTRSREGALADVGWDVLGALAALAALWLLLRVGGRIRGVRRQDAISAEDSRRGL